MDGRWILLGFGLLFGALTVAFLYRGEVVMALVAAVHAVFGLGGFWWNTTREASVEPRRSWFR